MIARRRTAAEPSALSGAKITEGLAFLEANGIQMSVEDTIGYQAEVEACVVCGKNVQGGGGFSRITHGERMVSLCCPLCLATFQNDPQPYVGRLEKNLAYHELRGLNEVPAQKIN